jgi:transposase
MEVIKPGGVRNDGGAEEYPGGLRERAIRLVIEAKAEPGSSAKAACRRIGEQPGISPENPAGPGSRRSRFDAGTRPGTSTDTATRLAELEPENRELRPRERYFEVGVGFRRGGARPPTAVRRRNRVALRTRRPIPRRRRTTAARRRRRSVPPGHGRHLEDAALAHPARPRPFPPPPTRLGRQSRRNSVLHIPQDHFLCLDGNDYSVHPSMIGRRVELAVEPRRRRPRRAIRAARRRLARVSGEPDHDAATGQLPAMKGGNTSPEGANSVDPD